MAFSRTSSRTPLAIFGAAVAIAFAAVWAWGSFPGNRRAGRGAESAGPPAPEPRFSGATAAASSSEDHLLATDSSPPAGGSASVQDRWAELAGRAAEALGTRARTRTASQQEELEEARRRLARLKSEWSASAEKDLLRLGMDLEKLSREHPALLGDVWAWFLEETDPAVLFQMAKASGVALADPLRRAWYIEELARTDPGHRERGMVALIGHPLQDAFPRLLDWLAEDPSGGVRKEAAFVLAMGLQTLGEHEIAEVRAEARKIVPSDAPAPLVAEAIALLGPEDAALALQAGLHHAELDVQLSALRAIGSTPSSQTAHEIMIESLLSRPDLPESLRDGLLELRDPHSDPTR